MKETTKSLIKFIASAEIRTTYLGNASQKSVMYRLGHAAPWSYCMAPQFLSGT